MNIIQNGHQSSQYKILGRMNINNLMYLYVPILFITPLYTYHMAVTHHQQKPFPNATVTQTACHYPQDIVFRFTMLIAASIISLSFFMVFRWLQNQCVRVGKRPLSKWYFYVTQFSMLCYSITIGTIDEKGIGKLHGPCAVTFFVIWFVVIMRITFFINQLRQWDTTVLTSKSMLLKKLLAGYVAGVWIYCIYGLATTTDHHRSNQFVVIVQWNSVLVNLLWVLSFVCEWKQISLCLDYYGKSQIKQQTNSREQQLHLRN